MKLILLFIFTVSIQASCLDVIKRFKLTRYETAIHRYNTVEYINEHGTIAASLMWSMMDNRMGLDMVKVEFKCRDHGIHRELIRSIIERHNPEIIDLQFAETNYLVFENTLRKKYRGAIDGNNINKSDVYVAFYLTPTGKVLKDLGYTDLEYNIETLRGDFLVEFSVTRKL